MPEINNVSLLVSPRQKIHDSPRLVGRFCSKDKLVIVCVMCHELQLAYAQAELGGNYAYERSDACNFSVLPQDEHVGLKALALILVYVLQGPDPEPGKCSEHIRESGGFAEPVPVGLNPEKLRFGLLGLDGIGNSSLASEGIGGRTGMSLRTVRLHVHHFL